MKRERVIVFAGTEEGRKLFEYLYVCGVPVDLSVATEYGREMIEHGRHRVLVNRLDEQEMRELFQHNGYTLVIDATHPYATEVTENIQTSCYAMGIPYLRVLRQSISEEGVVCALIFQRQSIFCLPGREISFLPLEAKNLQR